MWHLVQHASWLFCPSLIIIIPTCPSSLKSSYMTSLIPSQVCLNFVQTARPSKKPPLNCPSPVLKQPTYCVLVLRVCVCCMPSQILGLTWHVAKALICLTSQLCLITFSHDATDSSTLQSRFLSGPLRRKMLTVTPGRLWKYLCLLAFHIIQQSQCESQRQKS